MGSWRWISQDPVVGTIFDPQNLNRYVFCKNNPLKYVDPDGRFVFVPALVAAGSAAVAWAETPAGQRAIGAGLTVLAAITMEITKPKIETIEKVKTKEKDEKGVVVAHYTSKENAEKILTSGIINNSSDTPYVEVMTIDATSKDALESGARYAEVRIILTVPADRITKANEFANNPRALRFVTPGKQNIKFYNPTLAPPVQNGNLIEKIISLFKGR